MVLFFSLSCSTNINQEKVYQSLEYTDFIEKRIGLDMTSVTDLALKELFLATPVYYDSFVDAIADLRHGRIDAYIVDLYGGYIYESTSGNEDITCIEIPVDFFSWPSGAFALKPEIIIQFNQFLNKIKNNGTLFELQNKWFFNPTKIDDFPISIPQKSQNGVLNVVTNALEPPFTFIGKDGKLKGFAIELVLYFAADLEKELVLIDVDTDGLMPYVLSGKADLGIANIAITQERQKDFYFSDKIFDNPFGLLTLRAHNNNPSLPKNYQDYIDQEYHFGVQTGDIYAEVAKNVFHVQAEEYMSVYDLLESVKLQKIDVALIDKSYVKQLRDSGVYPEFDFILVPEEEFVNKSAMLFHTDNLVSQYNQWLSLISEEGLLDEITNRWLGVSLPAEEDIPQIELTGENGVLNIADTGDYPPFTYYSSNGELVGFNYDLVRRFAQYLGLSLNIMIMNYGAILPAVASGKVDMSASVYTITDERENNVIFGNPCVISQGTLVILSSTSSNDYDGKNQRKGRHDFIFWLKTGIHNNLITDHRWKTIMEGLKITMIISILAQLFGIIWGALICFILTRKSIFLSWWGNLYCGLINGTPLVVLLMITYYIIFGKIQIFNIFVAVITFTGLTGAVVGKTLKEAIETVDQTEIDAARSLGFSCIKTLQLITLPHALKRAIPSLTTNFIELVKSTSIVGYIAILDLTRAGDIIRSRTYDAFFPILLVAIIYLILTSTCVILFKIMMKRIYPLKK